MKKPRNSQARIIFSFTMEQISSDLMNIEMPSFGDDLLATAIQSITADVPQPTKPPVLHQAEIPSSSFCYQQITERGEQLKLFGLLLQELRTLNQRLGGLEQTIQQQQQRQTLSPEAVNIPLKFDFEPVQIPVTFRGDDQPVTCKVEADVHHRHHRHHHEKANKDTEKSSSPKNTAENDRRHPEFKRPKTPERKMAIKRKNTNSSKDGIGQYAKKMKL